MSLVSAEFSARGQLPHRPESLSQFMVMGTGIRVRFAAVPSSRAARPCESHAREKLFNAGRVRHHAGSFRKQLRIVASKAAAGIIA
jgi:hypothetical protein